MQIHSFEELKSKANRTYAVDVSPLWLDHRAYYKATAVIRFWGIIRMIDEYQDAQETMDLEASLLRHEFLSLVQARYTEAWALSVISKPEYTGAA